MYDNIGRNLVLERKLLKLAIERNKHREEIWDRREEILGGLAREWTGFETDPGQDEKVPVNGF